MKQYEKITKFQEAVNTLRNCENTDVLDLDFFKREARLTFKLTEEEVRGALIGCECLGYCKVIRDRNKLIMIKPAKLEQN